STASPAATQVGLNVLKHDGNAIDAAVAVAFALAVAYPEAGNLGGGGFLVYYDAQTKGVWTLDFLEVAPLAATKELYVQNPSATRFGPLSAAVPGTVAGLEAMHKKFGSRPWGELVAPAIAIAREGVTITPEVALDLLAADGERKIAPMAPLFYPDGKPLTAGAKAVQADPAATLARSALKGASDYYGVE